MIGTQLLHYRIESHLGSGGMGHVYRATDTRLGRSVAVKLLPDAFALEPDRVARFEREARLLASLNHPNIAGLHGIEPADGKFFLVMELIEGETLAERIRRGLLPLQEALGYARQIIEALEAAHEKGVVHRDLKPANIKVTPEGRVKVLDFGLAKAMDPVAATSAPQMTHSPTLTLQATLAGVVLGTAAYMAPEQAKGRATDQRSDLFAFGCVLYEMLTGRQAFPGDNVTEVIASVIKSEADLNLLPPHLSPRLTDLIRRCLEKDPKNRWHAAGDIRVELDAIAADPHGVRIVAPAVRQPLWKRAVVIGATAAVAAAVAGTAAWNLRPAPDVSITRFSIVLPERQTITRPGRPVIAVSPDGRSIVYVANRQLYLRRLNEVDATPIEGTDQDVNTPVFSPNGQAIAFYSFFDSKLKRIPVDGGAAVTITDLALNPFGVTWGPDDQILIGMGPDGILRVPAAGGTPESIIKVEAGEIAYGPQLLPDREHVLFTIATGTSESRWDDARIVVESLRSGERRTLIEGGSDGRYVPTGHIVYALGANMLAAPLDLGALSVSSGAVSVVEGIGRSPAANTAAAYFDLSPAGTLVYFRAEGATESGLRSLAIVSQTGSAAPLPFQPASFYEPAVSPDGTQLAVRITQANQQLIWIYDLAGASTARPLLFGGLSGSPQWTPDGTRILFLSNRDSNSNALFWQAADGSGVAERLTDPLVFRPTGGLDVSRTGIVLFRVAANEGDVMALDLNGDRTPRPILQGPGSQGDARMSPDGHWIVYLSDETGRIELYVQPYPQTGAKYQIPGATGGGDPMWSPDSRRIFYQTVQGIDITLHAIDMRTSPSVAFSNPTAMPNVGVNWGSWPYSVMPDGRLVVMQRAESGETPTPRPEIRVTMNWFEELRQRVPR